MKYKYLIKKVLAYRGTLLPSEYAPVFPDSKPIADKLKEMGKSEKYLYDLIVRNRKSFKEKHTQFPNEPIFNIIYWCLDFDITESYVWWKAEQNMNSEGFKQFLKDLISI